MCYVQLALQGIDHYWKDGYSCPGGRNKANGRLGHSPEKHTHSSRLVQCVVRWIYKADLGRTVLIDHAVQTRVCFTVLGKLFCLVLYIFRRGLATNKYVLPYQGLSSLVSAAGFGCICFGCFGLFWFPYLLVSPPLLEGLVGTSEWNCQTIFEIGFTSHVSQTSERTSRGCDFFQLPRLSTEPAEYSVRPLRKITICSLDLPVKKQACSVEQDEHQEGPLLQRFCT